jgi:outer membrane protein OmpA-like peptidoglycan-associated protein
MARSILTTLSTDSDAETIDSKTTRYGRPWQVLVAIGDAYYERKDWANAVKIYEEALDDMRDVAANPTAPPAEVEKRTYKRAVEARALAPIFVASRQFRGQKSGLASPNFRNFTAEAVPVPVQFEYDSDVLTENGIAAVTDIFAYVKDAAPEHLVITGYTDPRGSEAYNADLSLRRASAVREYLIGLGYTGTIEAFGEGESKPFAPDDPSKYSEEELYAFDRRVEYKLPE